MLNMKIDGAPPLESRREIALERSEKPSGFEYGQTQIVRSNPVSPAFQKHQLSQVAALDISEATLIEQEIERLAQGELHRLDILNSRAPEVRRAIEAFLLKRIRSEKLNDETLRRIRSALEEFGFIARRCAALLCSYDAFERVNAAKLLGGIRSPMALPFLVEALYDAENAVRIEAVVSIGALGMPRGIGALLDAARRYDDIPPSLFQNALNACSLEPEIAKESLPASSQQDSPTTLTVSSPVQSIKPLPEVVEHETFYEALEQFQHPNIETRVTAAVLLSQFQAQRAVEALSLMAMYDPEPRVRVVAVTSLGVIDHESVFPYVLLALADEAQDVRATASRSLSVLSVKKADAFIHLVDKLDEIELREVAYACAKTGLAAQAFDQLLNADPRLASESFALLSMMVKAGHLTPFIRTIEHHADINVRLAVVQLLKLQGNEDVGEMLCEVIKRGDIPDEVRRVIVGLYPESDIARSNEPTRTPTRVNPLPVK